MNNKKKGLTPRSEQAELVKHFNAEILWVVHSFVGYITVKNAALITGYTIPGARTGLRRLVKEKLLKEHKYKDGPGRATSIFGITRDGRYEADDAAISKDELIGWNIGRLRYDIINHEMAIQKVCHQLSKYNEKSSLRPPKTIGGTQHRNGLKGGRKPDAMLGKFTAIEIETTLKSRVRYQNILSTYDKNITCSWWFSPPKLAAKLDRIFEKIEPTQHVTVFNMDEKCNFEETEKSVARGIAKKQAEAVAAEKIKIKEKQAQERIEAEHRAEQKERKELSAKYQEELEKKHNENLKKQRADEKKSLMKNIMWLLYLVSPAYIWLYIWFQHNNKNNWAWPTAMGFMFYCLLWAALMLSKWKTHLRERRKAR